MRVAVVWTNDIAKRGRAFAAGSCRGMCRDVRPALDIGAWGVIVGPSNQTLIKTYIAEGLLEAQ